MQSAEVTSASTNTRLIIDALVKDNRIPLGEDVYTSPFYFDVAVAGFNFIDDQCTSYFDKLFYLQRDRQLAQGILQGGTQAAATILTITRASELTFGVVAAAFGFSSTLADSVAGSFLFQFPPATTYGFVKELQTAYRKGVNPAYVTSPSAAYHLMQDYLAICLPPSIEARLVDRVANTRAMPQSPSGGDPSPGVQVADKFAPVARVVDRTPPQTNHQVGNRAVAQAAHRPQPTERLTKPPRPSAGPVPPGVSQFFLAYDPARDSPAYISDVLKKLCAPEAGQGTPEWVAKVKVLVSIYESTPQFEETDAKPTVDGKIDLQEGRTILASAACRPEHRNYFEKKTFADQPPTARFVERLFKYLNKPVPDKLNGITLDTLRPDIRQARTKLGMSKPNEFISDQVTPDFEDQLSKASQ